MNTQDETETMDTCISLRATGVTIQDGVWPCSTDFLERHKEIENLSPVLLNVDAPLVFAIDAPWGGGKTTFIQLWQHFLVQRGQQSLYLNAWESDFADDPLLPMLSTLDEWLELQQEDSAPKQAWSKAKEYAPGIIKSTAVAATKAATFGALDLEKEYEKIVADLAGGAVSSLVDGFNVQKQALRRFKEQLQVALNALPEGQQNLIIFVDELDRCKPTYAIELLERIKHLFDIERLVFVLAVNREQLSKSIQGVYGSTFNGSHYLKRFIDLDYQLKIPDREAYIRALLNQPGLRNYFATRTEDRDLRSIIAETLDWFCKRFSYQLRDIDQLISRFRLVVKTVPVKQDLDILLLLTLMVLRSENENLYDKFISDISHVNDVIYFLLGESIDTAEYPQHFGSIAGWLFHSGYDELEEFDPEPLLDVWQKRYYQMIDSDKRKRALDRLIRLARHQGDSWYRGNIRAKAYRRIELINEIDITQSS